MHCNEFHASLQIPVLNHETLKNHRFEKKFIDELKKQMKCFEAKCNVNFSSDWIGTMQLKFLIRIAALAQQL